MSHKLPRRRKGERARCSIGPGSRWRRCRGSSRWRPGPSRAHGFDAAGDAHGARLVETGARYQMWHALAMLACLALMPNLRLPLWLWLVGTALFSFSLYALALGAPRPVAL